ncbi:hypothetical protein [Paenibacillus terrigena]|uniref:hypothetical protein n=1 Tax=Paenibacillus terrigena TaxID=369333 RepID=UPI0028D7D505|nr:hypothetical protein [Paenibacillus terrigena]
MLTKLLAKQCKLERKRLYEKVMTVAIAFISFDDHSSRLCTSRFPQAMGIIAYGDKEVVQSEINTLNRTFQLSVFSLLKSSE